MRHSNIKLEGVVTKKSHQCIVYADDVALLARTKEEMKNLKGRCDREAAEYGLVINEAKIKYMTTKKSKEGKEQLM